jgi:hypothetical protein
MKAIPIQHRSEPDLSFLYGAVVVATVADAPLFVTVTTWGHCSNRKKTLRK